jgi:hypothetical protein
VQISRANPEKSEESDEPLASIPPEPKAIKTPVMVSNAGEEVIIQEDEPEDRIEAEAKEPEAGFGAPVKLDVPKVPVAQATDGEVQIQKADKEKLAKVADVQGSLSLSQWSEILGFRRSSSAHQFLQRMSDKGLVDLQKTMEGVEVRLSSKGKTMLETFEVADAKQ